MPNVELVDSIISDLKNVNATGLDGLSTEHLQFSHPALALVLVNLFKLLLKYGTTPDEIGNSYTVSIPKYLNKTSVKPGLSMILELYLSTNFGVIDHFVTLLNLPTTSSGSRRD